MKKIIEILKSGNFSILYHDNGMCGLYKGKKTYNQLKEDEEAIAEFEDWTSNGYCPKIVELLTKALGGKTDSI